MSEPTGEQRPVNYRWLWYFAALGLVCIAVYVILSLFHSGQQLTLDELRAARQKWVRHGPRSYVLRYEVKAKASGRPLDDSFVVEVVNGTVVKVQLEGRRLTSDKFKDYGMEALFDFIEEWMVKDAKPNRPRTYCRGVFGADGRLKYFVRRVMGLPSAGRGKGDRGQQEIIVKSVEPL